MKGLYIEFNKNPTNDLVAETGSQASRHADDWWTVGRGLPVMRSLLLSLDNNQYSSHLKRVFLFYWEVIQSGDSCIWLWGSYLEIYWTWKYVLTMVYGHSSDCSFGLIHCQRLWAYNVSRDGCASFCRWDGEGWESIMLCPLYRTSVSPWSGIFLIFMAGYHVAQSHSIIYTVMSALCDWPVSIMCDACCLGYLVWPTHCFGSRLCSLLGWDHFAKYLTTFRARLYYCYNASLIEAVWISRLGLMDSPFCCCDKNTESFTFVVVLFRSL